LVPIAVDGIVNVAAVAPEIAVPPELLADALLYH
jgi:hypothetical protein